MKQNPNGSRTAANSGRTQKSDPKKSRPKVKRIPREAAGILMTGAGALLIIALHTERIGPLGEGLRFLFFSLLGSMSFLFAYCFMIFATTYLFNLLKKSNVLKKMVLLFAFFAYVLLLRGILDRIFTESIYSQPYAAVLFSAIQAGDSGTGVLSAAVLYWMVKLMGRAGSLILLSTLMLATVWFTMPQILVKMIALLNHSITTLKNRFNTSRHNRKAEKEAEQAIRLMPDPDLTVAMEPVYKKQLLHYEPVRHHEPTHPESEIAVQETIKTPENDETIKIPAIAPEKPHHAYRLPPLSLLDRKMKGNQRIDRRDMLAKAKMLEETLESFGVEAKVIKITQGPTITRYELQPSKGVKVSKIVNLSDDIALNLAASSIRIEAPIPGKAAIGIEIPNEEIALVLLKELLEAPEYKNFTSPLPFALGKNIAGDAVVFDINKMPHLLVAGATGSGKSVCINTLILSLLFKSKPDDLKMLMIDPKVVELNQYNGIPHLMIPVVTDPKKATGALRWVVTEMEERYHRFAEVGARDIAGFNLKNKDKKLPYIVVIIDELADLMLVAAKEVEDYICRLAQMARAAGIHLIIATQRPSVDVITGIIKANIPSRIAFSVASQVDSRTIIDMGGAEKLLGKGDMLFHPVGVNKPFRIQGAFVSDEEVRLVVDYLKSQTGEPEYQEEILSKIEETDSGSDYHESDDVFQEALRLAFDHQQISISMLQRKLKMGYNRAARLIDEMESRGYVGPNEGTKPRKVINRPHALSDTGDSPPAST
jgi:DNA segregation ATPase FtsK/SpoIIIE, S-DNA-T family